MRNGYCVLMSARNDEHLIDSWFENIMSQRKKARFIIMINDSSKDSTYFKMIELASKYNHIYVLNLKNERIKIQGVNLAMALNEGLKYIAQTRSLIKYVFKIDIDARIPEDYTKKLIEYMDKDERIGISGGIISYSKKLDRHLSDSAKMYRYDCIREMGFPIVTAFDNYMLIRAVHLGWLVKKYPIEYYETRTFKRKTLRRWYFSGRARYLMRYPLLYQLFISLSYMRLKPYFLGSLIMFFSYLLHHLTKWKVYDNGFYKFIKLYLYNDLFNSNIFKKKIKF